MTKGAASSDEGLYAAAIYYAFVFVWMLHFIFILVYNKIKQIAWGANNCAEVYVLYFVFYTFHINWTATSFIPCVIVIFVYNCFVKYPSNSIAIMRHYNLNVQLIDYLNDVGYYCTLLGLQTRIDIRVASVIQCVPTLPQLTKQCVSLVYLCGIHSPAAIPFCLRRLGRCENPW